jgi:hypothetical protein
MTWCVFLLLLAQEQIRTVTYDGLGQPVPAPTVAVSTSGKNATITEKTQSINGTKVPLEKIEERILRDDAQGRVVERLIRRFDPNGNPGPPEKMLIEEQKRSDGGSTVRTTLYRGDLNGNLAVAEKSLTETQKNGSILNSQETVERPSINGSLELAEKREAVVQNTGSGELKNTVVYRRDENGRLYEAKKEVSERKVSNGESIENTAVYESKTGQLALAGQTVKKTVKTPGGEEHTEIDVYTRDVPGIATDASNSKPMLREQQLIERKVSSSGVVETVDVRRPSIADPNRLGPAKRLSETVCKGKCDQ